MTRYTVIGNGYYRHYCYLPLYIFCGEQLLCARLRTADQDGAAGTVEELAFIIGRLRVRWPAVRIIVRGDGGFCREELMSWCEGQGVEYVLGLAKNARLKALIAEELQQAKAEYESAARRPGCSRSVVTRPLRVGPVNGAWWARPNT